MKNKSRIKTRPVDPVIQAFIVRAGPGTTFRTGELLFPKVLLDRALSWCGRTERGSKPH